MKLIHALALLATGCALGCMASSPPLPAEPPTSHATGTIRATGVPLILDRSDLRIGTTVHFNRLPDATEIYDLSRELGLAHVALSLDRWPDEPPRLAALEQVPPEADVIVILRGYPPSRSAVDLWKLVKARLRLVVVVSGPPANSIALDWLNETPALERVIAEMDEPSRYGFERLQRPLSFRKWIG